MHVMKDLNAPLCSFMAPSWHSPPQCARSKGQKTPRVCPSRAAAGSPLMSKQPKLGELNPRKLPNTHLLYHSAQGFRVCSGSPNRGFHLRCTPRAQRVSYNRQPPPRQRRAATSRCPTAGQGCCKVWRRRGHAGGVQGVGARNCRQYDCRICHAVRHRPNTVQRGGVEKLAGCRMLPPVVVQGGIQNEVHHDFGKT